MTAQTNALQAYLTPLLEKHTSGQVLIYDDLIHAWDASQVVLRPLFDPVVSKEMRQLHESQLQAYEAAARAALTESVEKVVLPSVDAEEEEASYIKKCLMQVVKPDWKVGDDVWQQVWIGPLKERARAAYNEEEDDEEGESDDDDEMQVDAKPAKKVVTKKRPPVKANKGLQKKRPKTGGNTVARAAIRGRRPRRGRGGGGAAAK